MTGAARPRLRKKLLAWYRENRRDLPWRRTSDPYAIWISETMLQQTRVETVIPYYERFLGRFPTVQTLADAEPDELMKYWEGLGYYSRARNLHAAARTVAHELGGEIPDDVDGLRALKGVGRYTAGAVASIAFDREAALVDGNVVRVLARILGIRDDVGQPKVVEKLWEEAARLVKGPGPGDFNQALMELGATVCVPRAPRCLACPVMRECAAYESGDAEALPVKKPRPKPKAVEGVAVYVVRRGKVLAVRRPPEGLLGGLWELPGGDLVPKEAPEEGLARLLRERVGLRVKAVEALGAVRHQFTHRTLRLHVFRAREPEGRVRLAGFDAHRWSAPSALDALATSKVARKALDLARPATS